MNLTEQILEEWNRYKDKFVDRKASILECQVDWPVRTDDFVAFGATVRFWEEEVDGKMCVMGQITLPSIQLKSSESKA